MKATELRIGNWVLCEPNNACIERTIDYEDFKLAHFDSERFKPIPLTEEWLEGFGFEQHHNDASFNSVLYIKNIFGNKPKEWGLYPKYLGSGYVVNKSLHLEHVHQLQNLYYALTGEELELKP